MPIIVICLHVDFHFNTTVTTVINKDSTKKKKNSKNSKKLNMQYVNDNEFEPNCILDLLCFSRHAEP